MTDGGGARLRLTVGAHAGKRKKRTSCEFRSMPGKNKNLSV